MAEGGGESRGQEPFRVFYSNMRRAFPDLRIKIEDIIAEGDKVAVRITAEGTHQGDGFGVGASGGPNEGEQVPIMKGKIDGDKITIEADHEGHTIKLALVLAEDHIRGDATIEMEGQAKTAKIDVTRVK